MYTTSFLDIPPLQSASGTVVLPGSKSISNRVLLLAALSHGTTHVHDVLDSDDTHVMLQALQKIGCTVLRDVLNPKTVHITGLGGCLPSSHHRRQRTESNDQTEKNDDPHPNAANDIHSLFLGNAGTAMRPLAAALALLPVHPDNNDSSSPTFELHGIPRMHERPIGDLIDALRQLGCDITCTKNEGYPPLRIKSVATHTLKVSQPILVRGDVSSQFLTALLLALPVVSLQLGTDIHLHVQGELISKPYIAITLNLLARFGVHVQNHDDAWQRFTIPQNSKYTSPQNIHVEADASSASYFIALGAIAAQKNAPVRIEGVGTNSIQGDIRFVDAAKSMGAIVTSGDNWLEIYQGVFPLHAIDLDCNHIPDAAMTLGVMALYANGTTTLRNIASWRVKETDRIVAMATQLRGLGATVEESHDSIRITPPQIEKWKRTSIHTYDDHRIAMCFSLAAFNPANTTVRIEDPKCVAKTFPNYFEALFSVVKTDAKHIPVIAIDGPSASGKGSLAHAVAKKLGYQVLDSGVLYRAVAYIATQRGLPLIDATDSDLVKITCIAKELFSTHGLQFIGVNAIHLTLPNRKNHDVTHEIHSEKIGIAASIASQYPEVRHALVDLQRSYRQLPGLVCDGRDMGTVIFPDASTKIFLTASVEKRASRRLNQQQQRNQHRKIHGTESNKQLTIENVLSDLKVRDSRDAQRKTAPLKPAENAILLDNSDHTVAQSCEFILKLLDV